MNIGILLRTPFQELVDYIHDEIAKSGHPEIRPAHGNVFQFIGKHGARITEMADKAQMTKQSMSYLVYYLEKRGYVERLADNTDARAIIFRLTKKGWIVVDAAERAISEFQLKCSKNMGSPNYKKLINLLESLNDSLK